MRGAQPAGAGPEPGPGGYAEVNGLRMYYEVHGKGKPLVLLHGSLSTIGTSFGATAPRLATTRMVIAVEQQGHGRTADAARPLSVRGMADDTAALLARRPASRTASSPSCPERRTRWSPAVPTCWR
jgi:pimeloyl-ACP methyl ester carboxylesterase